MRMDGYVACSDTGRMVIYGRLVGEQNELCVCEVGKKKQENTKKKIEKRTAAPRIPAWSPTAVLTRRYLA